MVGAVDRVVQLRKVFGAFDLDSSGTVEAKELLVLGMQRGELNQKGCIWTAEKNSALVQRMDVNRDGCVEEQEFVKHFCDALSEQDDGCFMGTMVEFLACVVGAKTKEACGKATELEAAHQATRERERKLQEELEKVASSGSADPVNARKAMLMKAFDSVDTEGTGFAPRMDVCEQASWGTGCDMA